MVAHHQQCKLWKLCKECSEDRFFLWTFSALHKELCYTSICRDNMLPQLRKARFLASADKNRFNNLIELFWVHVYSSKTYVCLVLMCSKCLFLWYTRRRKKIFILEEKEHFKPKQNIRKRKCWRCSNLSSVLSRLQNYWVAWCLNSSFVKSV